MAPNSGDTVKQITRSSDDLPRRQSVHEEDISAEYFGIRFRTKVVWPNVFIFVVLHAFSIYGLYLIATSQYKWQTLLFSVLLHAVSGLLGITAGAHRLWTHKSYKAKWPLRFVMMIFNCITLQNHIYEWSRDHRVHHKFTDTNADPHNTNRGFFFSHMGWLMMKKHPDVITKGKGIDLSDLEKDPIVMFQKRHYKLLAISLSYIVPTLIPIYFWSENAWTSYILAAVLRHIVTLHSTWAVNSVAHMWGDKPYDETIKPSENLGVSFFAMGEGYHNYHHTFPFDYSTSEYRFGINSTTMFIDIMAFFGLTYDRRKVNPDMVLARRKRTGNLKQM